MAKIHEIKEFKIGRMVSGASLAYAGLAEIMAGLRNLTENHFWSNEASKNKITELLSQVNEMHEKLEDIEKNLWDMAEYEQKEES